MKRRRKTCGWCRDLRPRSEFDPKVSRLGRPPDSICSSCVALIDSVRPLRERAR